MKVMRDDAFADFVAYVASNNKRIVCYGAGMVALCIGDIFHDAGIVENIACFVDRDARKHGVSIRIADRDVRVHGIDELLRWDLTDTALLVTCEMYDSVIAALNEYAELRALHCWIFPIMNRSCVADAVASDYYCNAGCGIGGGVPKIDKTIHYCWFGGGAMSGFLKNCLLSWRQHNPDYRIVLWNEGNYDVYKNSYVRQAHKSGKFAFVSDYARLDILYRHGGIYLDVDVEALKKFDDLLTNRAFLSYDQWPMPNSAIMGCVPGLEIVREMRDEPRGGMNFMNADGAPDLTTNSVYESAVLEKRGFRKDFSYQTIGDVAVYPPCFFASEGRSGMNMNPDERTYAVHHCLESWRDGRA